MFQCEEQFIDLCKKIGQIDLYKCNFYSKIPKHRAICLQMKPNTKQHKTKRKSSHLDHLQSLKIQQCPPQTNPKEITNQDGFYQNSSEANWEITHSKHTNKRNYDTKSTYSSFSTESKKSVVGHLCKAVEILRNKMPERSLEQIIIRLYQAAQFKKDQSCQGSVYGDMSQFSLLNDLERREDEKEQLQVKKEAIFQPNIGDNERKNPVKTMNQIRKISSQDKTQMETQQELLDIEDKAMKRNEELFQYNLNQQQANYIYKPKGQQVVVEYLQKDTYKRKFVNMEEQKKYQDQRFVAQSFIHRGYGVCECRKQLEIQNKNIFMHRDTYKALSTSMMIFAFRKLESFISIECGKKIKFIDRHQMQSIYITLLNCRINMQPEYVITLMKYIKACYGIGDVVIGEIQSVKLYLTCQKYLYGKNVTMQFLEKIGEIKLKKEIQQTLVYINNRSKRYQQRLVTLRRTRKQKKMRLMGSHCNSISNLSNSREQNVQSSSVQMKTQETDSQISFNEWLKVQDIQLNKQQQESEIAIELAKEYVKNPQILSCIYQLKIKFPELQTWRQYDFQGLYISILKKSLQKVQIEAEIIRDERVKWVSSLQSQFFDRLSHVSQFESLRIQILYYFVLTEPNLPKLRQVLTMVKSFVTRFQPCNQFQNSTQDQKLKRTSRVALTESIKQQNTTNNSLTQNQISLNNSNGFDLSKHIIQQSNFDSQLQNLSAELFDDDIPILNNLSSRTDQNSVSSRTDQNSVQNIHNYELNFESKM